MGKCIVAVKENIPLNYQYQKKKKSTLLIKSLFAKSCIGCFSQMFSFNAHKNSQ